VIATGNLNSTQPATVDYLRAHGVRVVGGVTRDRAERAGHLDTILDARPDVLLDNGGDLFVRFLERPYDGLLGGTEETTSGRQVLAPRRAELNLPILVINDSPIKAFGENQHGVGLSCLESYLRFTNRITNGERVVVIGYGWCGRGVAENFRNAHCQVTVVDVDPVACRRALFDGYRTAPLAQALADADLVVTVTGGGKTIGAAEVALLRDGAILANAGHEPDEIDLVEIEAVPGTSSTTTLPDVRSITGPSGRTVHVLGAGHMFNLAGPGALGNSIQAMDLGFSMQSRCLEWVATGRVDARSCVVPVPREIDVEIAEGYLALKRR
jgi:adenosylhomocysteinase